MYTTDLDVCIPRRMVMEVPCSYCNVSPRESCMTTGKLTPRERDPHNARWDLALHRSRTREMWFVITKDDPQFGLHAGDILRCVDYPYDAKVSVLFREEDGHIPECNQYRHDVMFLGFVPLDMTTY